MPGPFIFIATSRLRDGRFSAGQQRVPELAEVIEASEPRLIAFSEYVDEDRSQVSVVQIHPDAASMEFRLEVVGDHARRACAQTLAATTGIQALGTPAGSILRMPQQQARAGAPLSINPLHLGGFTRARES
jgi:hypothetical protein